MSELSFKLEVFEGPLDLLLSLIAKNKVDIYDIPIALILDQYMDYIEKMRLMDMEVAGEFIVMAADLMLIKSRMLLPKPESVSEEEEDPRAKLARALIEYKRAKEAASFLSDQYSVYAGRIAKEPEVIDTRSDLPEHIDIELLEKALQRVLNKNCRLPELARDSELAHSRSELIAIFSATLELLKVQRVTMENQEEDVVLTINLRHLREGLAV